jgi:hypothetical protein
VYFVLTVGRKLFQGNHFVSIVVPQSMLFEEILIFKFAALPQANKRENMSKNTSLFMYGGGGCRLLAGCAAVSSIYRLTE